MNHKILVLVIRLCGYTAVLVALLSACMGLYLLNGLVVQPMIIEKNLELELDRLSRLQALDEHCFVGGELGQPSQK